MQKQSRLVINGDTLKKIMTFLVALYFLFTSLDYVAKIGDTNISYLRPIGIAIYIVGLIWYIVDRKIPMTKLHLMMLYLMVFPCVACVWAVNMSTGFSTAFSIVTTVLVVFIASGFDFDERQIGIIEFFCVTGGVIVGILIISNYGFSGFLNSGRIYLSGKESSDPNGMAARLFLPFILSAKLLAERKEWYKRLYYLLSFILIFLMFFMCGSRGAFVSLVVGMSIFIIKLITLGKFGRLRIGTMIVVLIALVAVSLNLKNILPEDIYSRLFSAQSYEGGKSRSYIWESFFSEVFWGSPIFGYGTGGVYYKLGELLGFSYYGMHNSYLSMIGEYGIFYLPVFIAFLVKVRNKFAAMKRPVLFLIFYGICGVIFFLDGYYTKYFWNMILYMLIVSNRFENRSKESAAAGQGV